ncbi:hypothetical protein EZV62_020580 [Acer yangbiense]|uniref:Gnk2-homologous domain-containing protein n=1 Tax=Acer yangbiense TaxID=1000413 RepID=A0A5C7HE91_9ROSI|nr:hypothetical protein EZV62_020580 [Acer yangbiense]
MSSSRVSSSLYFLITFAFLLQNVLGRENLLKHMCSKSDNFTANGPYESNLNKLTAYLNYQTPPTGFGKGSLGEKPSQANGIALCRGDMSSSECKNCVVEASSEIRKRCPYNKAAIIWYDNCLFKYSDKDFFGKIDSENKFYMWNTQSVSDPETFNQNTRELLSQLAKEAQADSKFYAAGQKELNESTTLYGMTQCTRDLSSYECKKCLDGIIGELPDCCDGKQGGFGKGSLGQKPNQANGLALCRGDMSSSDCKSCVVEASSEIRKRCPNNKAAIIWYDNCLFKYSDKDFFGKIDNQNKFYMYNTRSVSDPKAFNQNTKELLSQLAKDAQADSKLYAVGQMGLDGSTELYGLTQCTRDLSSYDCKKCLDGIIGELPSCCDGKQGGRVISGSCWKAWGKPSISSLDGNIGIGSNEKGLQKGSCGGFS